MKPQLHRSAQGGARKLRERRERTISYLENQLKTGTKTEKVDKLTLATTGANQIPLTDSDRTRIERELQTLKTRI